MGLGGLHQFVDDAVHRLIQAGHRLPDVLGYTLTQLEAFLAADRRLEAHRLSVELALLSTAAHGSRDGIRALQAELQRRMQP